MKIVTLSFVFRGMKAKTSLKRDYLALWRWKIKFPLLSLSPRSNSLFLSASRCSCVERSSEESPDPVVGKSPAVDTRSCPVEWHSVHLLLLLMFLGAEWRAGRGDAACRPESQAPWLGWGCTGGCFLPCSRSRASLLSTFWLWPWRGLWCLSTTSYRGRAGEFRLLLWISDMIRWIWIFFDL